MAKRNPQERFWEKVDKNGPVPEYAPHLGPCWLWTSCLNLGGYGYFTVVNGMSVGAHRFAYESMVGPIPKGLTIDHLCRNPPCVNPAHLEPVTNALNIMRGMGLAAENARKTHCKRGHEFTPENTRIKPKTGARCCKTCDSERSCSGPDPIEAASA